MKHTVREKWIEALRSGRYRKGRGALRKKTARGQQLYCALGVLCELAAEEGTTAQTGNALGYLPQEVMAWAGLSTADPEVGDSYITWLNDSDRLPFDKIAKLIDDDPERAEDLPDWI